MNISASPSAWHVFSVPAVAAVASDYHSHFRMCSLQSLYLYISRSLFLLSFYFLAAEQESCRRKAVKKVPLVILSIHGDGQKCTLYYPTRLPGQFSWQFL